VQYELIKKSGAWFSYQDERIGQGRDNVKVYLEEHPEVAAGIEAQVRQTLTLPQKGSEALAATAQAASLEPDLFHDEYQDATLDADFEAPEERRGR
jgi:recombination protein RecA